MAKLEAVEEAIKQKIPVQIAKENLALEEQEKDKELKENLELRRVYAEFGIGVVEK